MAPGPDRQRVGVLALGVLLVVGLGIAAGTIGATIDDPGSGGPGPDGDGAGNGQGETPVGGDVLPSNPDTDPRIEWSNGSGTTDGTGAPGASTADDDGALSVLTSPAGGLGLLVVVGVLAVAVALRSAGRDAQGPDRSDGASDEASDPAALSDVARAAGRAADRIGESDPDNAVYEAWLEMTGLLAVDDRRTTTPGEFAAAAVEAGMAPADVDRVTAVFERVRYGGADVTAERERAAQEAFRRIEETYADDGKRTTDDGGPSPDGDGPSTDSDGGPTEDRAPETDGDDEEGQ